MAMRLLNQQDIQRCFSMEEAIQCMEQAYRTMKPATDHCATERHFCSMATPQQTLVSMAGYVESLNTAGAKLASLVPNNQHQRRPTVQGCLLLFDPDTGQPIALLDAATVTALKTAALSALVTQRLAPLHAHRLLILGTGVQAEHHVLAMLLVRPITEVVVCGRTASSIARMMERPSIASLRDRITLRTCQHLDASLFATDLVCTTTSHPHPTPLITHTMLCQQPLHVNAIGGSSLQACELSPCVYQHAQLVVDDQERVLAEANDVQQALQHGLIKAEQITPLITFCQQHQQRRAPTTVYRSVGHVHQDLVLASAILHKAEANNLGQRW